VEIVPTEPILLRILQATEISLVVSLTARHVQQVLPVLHPEVRWAVPPVVVRSAVAVVEAALLVVAVAAAVAAAVSAAVDAGN
jgi:hypothetical protein